MFRTAEISTSNSKPPEPEWFVYIIEADDGSYYTGVTIDVDRRFEDHKSGPNGARYFRGRKPKAVVYIEKGHNKSSAHRREVEIKRLTRLEKQTLVQTVDKNS